MYCQTSAKSGVPSGRSGVSRSTTNYCERSLELKRREVEALEKIAHELDHFPRPSYAGLTTAMCKTLDAA